MAIVSDKPQTTRRAIRGIATGDDWQLVIVDLPGVQRPRDPLTERMQAQVERELRRRRRRAVHAERRRRRSAPGDRFIAEAIRNAGVPAVTVLNKVDLLKPRADRGGAPGGRELGVAGRDLPGERADAATACPRWSSALVALLPEGPFLYPPEEHTDLPERSGSPS